MALSKLEIELSMNLARLQSDVGKATRAIEGMARDFKQILGGVAVGALAKQFADFVNRTIDAADALNDLRTRSALSGQELLLLQGAAVRGGQSLESISDIVSKLSKRLGAAEIDSGEAAKGFAALGIAVTSSDGSLKNMLQIMSEAGERSKGWADGMNKAAIYTAAFGKGGDKLIPVAESLKDVTARFKQLGITIDEDFISRADKYKDTMADLNIVNQMFANMLVSQLLPYMQKYQDFMISITNNSEKMKAKTDALVFGLKAVATTLYGMFQTIAAFGELLAGVALVDTFLLKGDLKGAADALRSSLNAAWERMKAIGDLKRELFDGESKRPDMAGGLGGTPFGYDNGGRPDAPSLGDPKAVEAAQKAFRDLDAAVAKSTIERTKYVAQNRLQILDDYYSRYIVGETEYWNQREEIQRSAYSHEIDQLRTLVQTQNEFANKQKANTKEYYEAQRQVLETSSQLRKLEAEAAQSSNVNWLGRAKAAEDYERMLGGIEAQLLSLQGKDAEAERLRVAMSQREMRQRAIANSDTATVGKLDEIARLSEVQFNFNRAREDGEAIVTRLRIDEQRLQDSVRTGAVGEFEALRRRGEMLKAAADEMERYAQVMREAAEADDNDKLRLQAEQLTEDIRKLRTESNLLGEKIASVFQEGFANAFTDFVMGAKTAKEAFKDFALSVVRNLVQMQAQAMAKSIFGSIGGGSSGGIFGGIGNLISGLFRAEGGPVAAGGSYIVGERGPELFTPGVSGNIIPNGAGGATIVQNIHIDSRSDQASIRAAMQRATDNALYALRNDLRNGGMFARLVQTA